MSSDKYYIQVVVRERSISLRSVCTRGHESSPYLDFHPHGGVITGCRWCLMFARIRALGCMLRSKWKPVLLGGWGYVSKLDLPSDCKHAVMVLINTMAAFNYLHFKHHSLCCITWMQIFWVELFFADKYCLPFGCHFRICVI